MRMVLYMFFCYFVSVFFIHYISLCWQSNAFGVSIRFLISQCLIYSSSDRANHKYIFGRKYQSTIRNLIPIPNIQVHINVCVKFSKKKQTHKIPFHISQCERNTLKKKLTTTGTMAHCFKDFAN